MADVRALLRAERQKRKINHPHASYTTDGKLHCNLCAVPIKNESAWQGHLHTSQHTLRLGKAQDGAAAQEIGGGGKKRKASALDSPAPEERKKAKPTTPEAQVEEESGATSEPNGNNANGDHLSPHDSPQTEQNTKQTDSRSKAEIDAAELANFERELADLEAEMPPRTILPLQPTISAAPMTAEEVAAQASAEHTDRRSRRDAELEAEKEDAENMLDEEFEQMQSLEDRVKRLKERRDALRKPNTEGKEDLGPKSAPEREALARGDSNHESDADDNYEDEDEDFDDWHFGAP